MKGKTGNLYSLVIPVYNEAELLEDLCLRLTKVWQGMDGDYELIFVDDGSTDNSFVKMKELWERDKRIKIVKLSRNFGHQIAITAGLEIASGNAIMLMDADLQDPPEMLPKFIEKWSQGYDVVYGIRKRRKENIFKKAAYTIFYRLLKKISSTDIPIDSGDFCLMDRRVVSLLRRMPERNRFVRGIRSWIGLKQTGLEYERDRRFRGEAKYTFGKLLKLAVDGILSFSFMPLRLATYFGLFISLTSFLSALFLVILKLWRNIPLKGWTSTVVIILFLGGVQLVSLGVIGEYIGRIYDEVKQRPLYVIEEAIGWESQSESRGATKVS